MPPVSYKPTNYLQTMATAQITKHGKDRYPDLHRQFMKLVEEVGELGKEINKRSNYEKRGQGETLMIAAELADVMLAAAELANKLDVDIFKVVTEVVGSDTRRFDDN